MALLVPLSLEGALWSKLFLYEKVSPSLLSVWTQTLDFVF
jgi:hypothetical protein